jgi:hypothetical protein
MMGLKGCGRKHVITELQNSNQKDITTSSTIQITAFRCNHSVIFGLWVNPGNPKHE